MNKSRLIEMPFRLFLLGLSLLVGCSRRQIEPPTPARLSPEPNEPRIQLTYVSTDSLGVYGVYALDAGCLDSQQPCLGETRELFQHSSQIFSISWSPDGNRVAFVSEGVDRKDDVFVSNWDGSNLENITNSSAYEGFSAWSPDGTRIAYESCPRDGCYIISAKPDGTEPVRLWPPTQVSSPRPSPHQVAWSPDGTRIAFADNDKNGALDQIFTMLLDGSGLVQLTDVPTVNLSPAYSPDGQWLGFVRESDPETLGSSDIFLIHPDGSGEINLTMRSVRTQLSLAWSPGGQWIAFDGDNDSTYDIYLIRPDGTSMFNVTGSTETDENYVAWRTVS